MDNFLLLLKCDFKKLFAPKKNGKLGALIAYIILAICILIISVVYTAIFALVLPSESKHISLALVCGIYTIFVLFTTVGSSKLLFGAKDYDLLNSLPIKPHVIILSKIAYAYILDLIGAFVCFIPAVITYSIIVGNIAITLLMALLALPFVPLFPLVLGFLLGTVINVISAKVKNKTLFGTIFGIIFFGAYFYFMFAMDTSNVNDEQMANAILNVKGIFCLFFGYSKGVTGNYLLLIAHSLFGVLFALGYIFIVSKYYKKVNTLIMSKRSSGKYKLQQDSATSSTMSIALLKREIKMFFSDTTIIINTIIGPLFSVVLAIFVLLKGGLDGLTGGEGITAEESANLQYYVGLLVKNFLPYVAVFFIGMSYYSAFAISIEGKNMWIIKHLPINGKGYFTSKLLMGLLLSVPTSLICIIVLGVALKAMWYDILIAVIITVAYAIFENLLGLAVNIKYHNFDWSSTAEVVKRGTSVNICAIIGILAVFPLIGVQLLASYISTYLGFAINFILIVSLAFLFYNLVFKNADKKLQNF